jgi:AmmeMemoRadiSam system protein B
MSSHIREPSFSGMFYADTPAELKKQIEWCYKHKLGPGTLPEITKAVNRTIVGLIIPHAGYMYSGPVAAHAYKELTRSGIYDTAVILSPNHTGYGPGVSIWAKGAWRTPLGEVQVNEEMAQLLISDIISADETAHIYEHSIEVQLPWLQYLNGNIQIVPITMMAQDYEIAQMVGKAVAKHMSNTIIIASTDFNHYAPRASTMEKDMAMIDAIEKLDTENLYKLLESMHCSMCGYGPVAATIVAAKEHNAKRGRLLKYSTSGDITGDISSVVGYASIALEV